jgi:hypothetical protein
MGAGLGALAADEVPVGGGYAPGAGRDAFAVGGDAHAATRHSPLEAGVAEHGVESFRLGGAADLLGAGDNPRGDVRCNGAARYDLCGIAKVGQP